MTVREVIDSDYECIKRSVHRRRQRGPGAGRGHRGRRPDAKVQMTEIGRRLGPIRSGHDAFRDRLQSGRITNSRPPSRVAFPSIGWRTARPSFVAAS